MTAPLAAGFHCPPGTKMLLEVPGYEDKLATACVGHVRGRFVAVQMPGHADSGRDALYQMLAPDNDAIVRYLHEGTVTGFSARVIKWIQVPFPLVFLTYPARLESHDLRRHPRVSCCLPGAAGIGGVAVSGMILDLSLSGCQFSVLRGEDENVRAVDIDDRLGLSCALFGTTSPELACSVKRVALSGRRLEIGLKFLDMPAPIRDALALYLQTALSVLA